MIVRSARVRDFKSITDSGDVTVEESVTCLVGKNESGKTAFLEALCRINPVPTGHPRTFKGLRDYPRSRWAKDKAGVAEKRPIEVNFQLTDEDVAAIEAEFGKDVIGGAREVTFWRSYANETLIAMTKADEYVALRHRLMIEGVETQLPDDCESFAQAADWLRSLDPDQVPVALALAAKFDVYDVEAELTGFVNDLAPEFLYFDQYSVLPGRVSVARLQNVAEDDLTSGERTALALLKLAGVETAEFSEGEYDARKAELEAASNAITQEVFEFWSQNKDLRVELDLDFYAATSLEDEETPFLEIRIRNLRHSVTLNFGEHSAGFVWFFSFLVAFSEYRKAEAPLVLLLDEPGLGLHASAQSDLLRYIDERLAPEHQVIYSTHSPFMVDATELQRVRTVEDVEGKGTRISNDVLATSSDTLLPLQAALGYDLAQTLLVGTENLVVEGPADYLYLTIMSEYLRTLGRPSLDPRWTIVPAGGLGKIPTFAALLGAHFNVAVVMNATSGGSEKIDSLVKRGIIEGKNVLLLNSLTDTEEADIEDLFDETFYLRLLRNSGITGVPRSNEATRTRSISHRRVSGRPLGDKLPGEGRIVERAELAIGSPYDHYRPARHFLEQQVGLLPDLDDETLERFALLFARLNSLLSSTSRT